MRRLRRLLVVLVVLGVVGFAVRWFRDRPAPAGELPGVNPATSREILQRVESLEAQERQVAETTWAPEKLAQRCGAFVDALWDALNAAPPEQRWDLVADLAPGQVVLPSWGDLQAIGCGIETRDSLGAGSTLGAPAWRPWVDSLRRAGWVLRRAEFRHRTFAMNALGGPAWSSYGVSVWVEKGEVRWVLEGDVRVDWAPQPSTEGLYAVERLDASQVGMTARRGPVPFRQELFESVPPPDRSFFIDPLMVHDLDDDGVLEVILAAKNRVYRRGSDGTWRAGPLCREAPGLLFTAALGDFDGDGLTDLLGARFEGLMLWRGGLRGDFEGAPVQAWVAPVRLRYGQVLACGDVDADGDLDVWLGQYRPPYERGQMPSPYHDANDGHPAYLLVNGGKGIFVEGTDAAGLSMRRNRRTYSASLADLNGDQALDLLVVSDFAGTDLYLNDGRGRFRDARFWFPDPLGFGMAHALADFDRDGRMDLLVTGMHCPTATRLEALGLRRPGFEALDEYRGRMTQGNRLYLGSEGRFQVPVGASAELGRSIAHSGWSWSCPAADLNNDGWMDVYVANGHETRQSVVDYEPEFWLSDIYVASSTEDIGMAAYFGAKFGRTRGRGQSYGGYEANRLFLNQGGRRFREAGWLLGVAVEQDSRNAVAADLDADGRTDLVVTTFEVWPETRQTIQVLMNRLEPVGHWVGLRLRPQASTSPLGAQVSVRTPMATLRRLVVTGDAHRTQSPWDVLFGLGDLSEVEAVEVRWPNGRTTTLTRPVVDRYHTLRP